IGREALAISGVEGPMPAQKAWMPPPVPRDSTRGAEPPPPLRAKVSATRVAKGKTVEEPAAQMPVRAFCEPGAPPSLFPQAARASRAAAQAVNFSVRIMAGPSPVVSVRRLKQENVTVRPDLCDSQGKPDSMRRQSRRLRMICDRVSIRVTAMTTMMTMADTALKLKAFMLSNSTWPMPPAPISPSTVAERLFDSKRYRAKEVHSGATWGITPQTISCSLEAPVARTPSTGPLSIDSTASENSLARTPAVF